MMQYNQSMAAVRTPQDVPFLVMPRPPKRGPGPEAYRDLPSEVPSVLLSM